MLKGIHRQCLLALAKHLDSYGGRCDDHYLPFAPVMEHTGLERRVVRRSIRYLARNGYTEFCSGLCTEDGEFAGSGYRPTAKGWEVFDNSEGAKHERTA